MAARDLPAIVQWLCDYEHCTKYLGCSRPQRTLVDFRVDPSRREAALRLRLHVGVKSRAKKVPVYVQVHPEHMLTAELVDSIPLQVRDGFVHDAAFLGAVFGARFALRQPATVVGPSNTPLAPKTAPSSGAALALLASLARAVSVTVYLAAGPNDRTALDTFVCAVNKGGLRSIASEYALHRLYAGKGGAPIDWTSFPQPPPLAESPPSYDELALTPPPPGQKRRMSSSRNCPPKKIKRDTQDGPEKAREALPDDDGQIQEQVDLEWSPDARLVDWLDQWFERRFEQSWSKACAELEGRFEEKLDDRIEDVVQQCTDHADVQVEELTTQIKDDVLSAMRDEYDVVRDEIKESLTIGRATLRVEFEE